ncbi:MAG TPA: M48 family metallopeptidase [Planctomycetota bacterium]|nr:M48 family metallopeptidase [Planctomycetota bacterium]
MTGALPEPHLAPTRAPSLAGRAVLAAALFVGFYVFALAIAALLLAVVWFCFAKLDRAPGMIVIPSALGALGILWSLVPRYPRFQPPGPELLDSEQPRLFERLRSIARAAGQPMPSHVYVVPAVNAFVAEHAGPFGAGRMRFLGIGLPLLWTLSVDEFEAVLAHEFGHFHGGDTSLGPWLYKTRATITRTIANLRDGRTRILQGPFVAYGNFFLRMTHSVSRSQEYAADALAARLVGGDALARGLVRIGKASMAYDPFLQNEIGPVLASGVRPPIADGFRRFLAADAVSTSLDDAIEKRKREEKQNPYDTHPTLRDRLAALARLPAGEAGDPDTPAITLLEHPERYEIELLHRLVPRLDVARMELVEWPEMAERVLVPGWERERAKAGETLRGKTIAELADDLAPKIGVMMPPPQEQANRVHLRGAAIALALRAHGWVVERELGEATALSHGDQWIEPFRELSDVSHGKTQPEEWREHCREAGIEGVELT